MTYQLSKRMGFSAPQIKGAIEKLDNFLGALKGLRERQCRRAPTTRGEPLFKLRAVLLKRDLCGGALYRCTVSSQEADGICGRDMRRGTARQYRTILS